ncbi:uncharacterized protein LOC135689349 [Rhopilema esculentum]|uniref:uncharacterized protein LOC135689349 n=1 Tax=Rhopilema esculentum TaxID=499914 RepID=UPI0031D6F3DC
MAWSVAIKTAKQKVFSDQITRLLFSSIRENMSSCPHARNFHWVPVPTAKASHLHGQEQDDFQHLMLEFTDPQPGGVKVGQAAKILDNVCSPERLVEGINKLTSGHSSVGILFNNFDGDVIGNWGREGAAQAWKAYLKGFGNLYCDSRNEGRIAKGRLNGERIVFVGMLDTDDLQQKALALAAEKREVEASKKLSALVTEHSLRLTNLVKEISRTSLECLFVLSGGDNAVYACAKAVKAQDNDVLLLRLDRHMDERDLSLRSDPQKASTELHPHSGNGVTHAKLERLIKYDFLIGCDYEHNNDQCIRNSQRFSQTCLTSVITMEEMRFDPKNFIDGVITEIKEIMKENSHVDVIVNIDCDTLNGIPSSAETFTGGLDPMWGCYLLKVLSRLPRLPKIIRIAELHYCGDEQRQRIAIDFAAEIVKSGVKAIQEIIHSK